MSCSGCECCNTQDTEAHIKLKFNGGDPMLLYAGDGAVLLSELNLCTKHELDTLKLALAAAKAAHVETKALYESWSKQALYLQQQHEPCEVHHGARRACGQCHDSLAQHLANEKAHAKELEALVKSVRDNCGCTDTPDTPCANCLRIDSALAAAEAKL